jgi:hypothetical protein
MMELTHVEVSVATGTLDPAFEADLDRLLHGVFGWTGATSVDRFPGAGWSRSRTYVVSSHVNFVLREQPTAMTAGTEDHLGFRLGPAELDELVERTVALASSDDRLELRHIEAGRATAVDLGSFVFKTFFVRYVLPVWFQFESYENHPGI